MRPHIIARQIHVDEATREYVMRRLQFALNRTLNRIGAITVRLVDENGPRGGIDKVCQVLLVLPGRASVVITERASELHRAIDKAIHRAAHAASRAFGRQQSGRRQVLPLIEGQ
ncbi:HPF/RaiA family ribosome-associated protein [Parachitinimonas caeni]|uniref:HPF/RaiA family ribosome-associated protein n=1 Tax=Parachitinimonas caeni TaxID=3031301 RepID=A0ABT7DR57_9NEIS|nr:HPF/RaiA family ribosome-associated protein [Parachitinimonas caeni]MDK2122551.1 HPF/RaiA family ribosome-associated protein [Parachitinimonas caeni]